MRRVYGFGAGRSGFGLAGPGAPMMVFSLTTTLFEAEKKPTELTDRPFVVVFDVVWPNKKPIPSPDKNSASAITVRTSGKRRRVRP